MGVKICKSCKKPMKSTDTHCRTCGTEFKNNPLILIVILMIIVGAILFVAYSLLSKKDNDPVKDNPKISNEVQKPIVTNWKMKNEIDKMTDKKNYYLSNQAMNVETGKSVDAGITIGCSYHGGLNGVFTSDTPIKIKDITKDGAIGEYEIRFDNDPMQYGSSDLTSINRVLVLNQSHLQQIEKSNRILIRITTGVDSYRTFEMNTAGGSELFSRMKEFCASKAKENKSS
ncbi:hypothetical protein ACBE110449_10455 [Acinetobacter bereziniae]|uniref:hypothetical protein n=1 Tax=Acinetobacter bereziniae TaxID=106648 RepID=UPI003B36B8D8